MSYSPDAAARPRNLQPEAPATADPLLRPGTNVWRRERAGRAAVLIDAANYYGALRDSMTRARHSILISGWDIDSRTPLVGETGEAGDGLPRTLGPFLAALAERNPALRIKLLLWDYSMLYALERELLPALSLHWNTPSQVELCLDDEVPFGASHHQKLAIIDDELAYSGGLDLTIRRWDRSAHAPADPLRLDPRDEPYPPFHDVQMVVDGEAAAAVADLFRLRWSRAACEDLPTREEAARAAEIAAAGVAAAGVAAQAPTAMPPATPPATLAPETVLEAAPGAAIPTDLWPRTVEPDFQDVDVGLARTLGPYAGLPGIREVERLFEDMIASAEHSLYIENQFLTNLHLAGCLIARMRERPRLQVVILGPRTHHTWLEHRTMLAGRIRFTALLVNAGVADRVRLVYPHVGNKRGRQADVMVHSKVMIVDDRVLRVGSANICNRSMALDSECDLAIEAVDEPGRAAIRAVRDRFLAEHLGASTAEVAQALRDGTLFSALDRLGGALGRRRRRQLLPIQDGVLAEGEGIPQMEAVADPTEPLGSNSVLADFTGHGPNQGGLPLWMRLSLVLLPILLLGIAWRYTPLAGYLNPQTFSASLQNANGAWGPLMALGLFLLLGLIAFPVNVLIVATAAAFGLWPGLAYAAIGALVSALLTYLVGRHMGTGLLRRLLGPRINRISRGIARNGIMAVTMVRLMPVAPFTLVNLVAGAIRIPLLDYMVGTALGLAPGLILMTALGDRLLRIMSDPSAADILGFLAVLLAWGALSYGLQSLIKWARARFGGETDPAGTGPAGIDHGIDARTTSAPGSPAR